MNKIIKFNKEAGQTQQVVLPGSKSIAARALVLDYIRGAEGCRANMPDCDDTRDLTRALSQMRVAKPGDTFNLGSGATSMRFFIALAASTEGFDGIVDCSEQMRRRPIAPLVAALQTVGADIRYIDGYGSAPIYIKGKKLEGGPLEIDGGVSSQFISALLLSSLLWKKPLQLTVSGEKVSHPYIEMTEKMIRRQNSSRIEPDWSAAGFFYEFALICPDRDVVIEDLENPMDSLQGDAATASVFRQLGVGSEWLPSGQAILHGDRQYIQGLSVSGKAVEIDMRDTPDLVPALSTALALADVRFRITNVSHLHHKESDRLEAMRTELAKLGYLIKVGEDYMSWNGERCPREQKIVIDSYGDHRIAMTFAMASAVVGTVEIVGAQCVAKSFPDFYDQIQKLGYIVG